MGRPAPGLGASRPSGRMSPASPFVTQAPLFSQGSGAGDEANGPRGEKQARTQGPTPPIMPQSRSSESARVATLPTRGPELSAQEQREGLLCRKQEMEAFGKKAANRYWVWPHCAEALSAPGSRQACPEPLPRLGEGVGLRSRVGPQWGREGRETINKMGLRWHWC